MAFRFLPLTTRRSKSDRKSKTKTKRSKLCDKSMLDCPICFLPLTIPVYQCHNGHTICSSCLLRLKKRRCPVCSAKKVGTIRNRAIEQVLESVSEFCTYKPVGCTAGLLTYSTKRAHEKACGSAPYTCPYSKDCGFLGTPAELFLHLNNSHKNLTVPFRSEPSFQVYSDDDFIHLLDDDSKGAIFILDTRQMKVTSISVDPELEPPVFCYRLAARRESAFFEFQPETVQCRCAAEAVWKLKRLNKMTVESGVPTVLDACFMDDNHSITLNVVSASLDL